MSSAFDNHTQTRVAISQLSTLLDLLYPEPGPDVYTLEDFVYRHPLTGLGELAAREIEQSQRINRAQGDFRQIGLCEFHIGLIYLYWGQYQSAQTQFAIARRQWSFVNEPAAVCLAHFAEGAAQELAYHYEVALAVYGKALTALGRIKFSAPSAKETEFAESLTTFVKEAQERVRHNLWLPVQESPQILLNQADYSDGCIWYQVINDAYFPQLRAGSFLLVNTQIGSRYLTPKDLLVVGTNKPALNAVEIEPVKNGSLRRFRRICLAAPVSNWIFDRNVVSGQVTVIPDDKPQRVHEDEVLGLVVGFWNNVRS